MDFNIIASNNWLCRFTVPSQRGTDSLETCRVYAGFELRSKLSHGLQTNAPHRGASLGSPPVPFKSIDFAEYFFGIFLTGGPGAQFAGTEDGLAWRLCLREGRSAVGDLNRYCADSAVRSGSWRVSLNAE